jgi:hypothetical protein
MKQLEMQAKFMYFQTTPTNKNCMHEEIKSRLNSDNAPLPFRPESFVFPLAVKVFKD